MAASDFGPFAGFLTNLGFFGPVAILGWIVIKWQRQDLIDARNTAQNERDQERARNEALTETVIALARSMEKTMGEFVASVRAGRKADG